MKSGWRLLKQRVREVEKLNEFIVRPRRDFPLKDLLFHSLPDSLYVRKYVAMARKKVVIKKRIEKEAYREKKSRLKKKARSWSR